VSRKQNIEELDTPSPAEMKKLIESLSPEERSMLRDPDFITEDEADLIVSDRAEKASQEEIPHIPRGRTRRQRIA
jgi:hypothetical protein